jgi:hypothetical protein
MGEAGSTDVAPVRNSSPVASSKNKRCRCEDGAFLLGGNYGQAKMAAGQALRSGQRNGPRENFKFDFPGKPAAQAGITRKTTL